MLNPIENAGITILAPNKAIRIRAPNSLFPNKNVPSPDRYMGNTGGNHQIYQDREVEKNWRTNLFHEVI